jgi:hypothetical protein
MKALSVRAPWWWFILYGGKDIENRDWPTKFRGTVYVHASKWFGIEEVDADFRNHIRLMSDECRARFAGQLITLRMLKDSGGCLVGTVDIVDCVERSKSPWFCGRYGFVLANPRPLDRPVPCKGALGFFEVGA